MHPAPVSQVADSDGYNAQATSPGDAAAKFDARDPQTWQDDAGALLAVSSGDGNSNGTTPGGGGGEESDPPYPYFDENGLPRAPEGSEENKTIKIEDEISADPPPSHSWSAAACDLRLKRAPDTDTTRAISRNYLKVRTENGAQPTVTPVTLTIPAGQEVSESVTLMAKAPVGSGKSIEERLLPIEFEVKHTEIDPATGQVVNPGANTMLRDEIVDIRIKVPPIGTTDWTVDLTVEPEAMRNENLPNRGNVQMYDFGQVETNGTVTPDKTQFVLQASAGGERTIKAVFNKEGTLKIKMKSTEGKLDFTSPDYTVQKRMRKYASLPSSQNHDLNQHDKAFVDAANHWGGVYQHQVDDVERLKAMGMAESDLGITDAVDILTIDNGDDVLETLRNTPPFDRFPGVSPLGGKALREVDVPNNSTKMLSYPAANADSASAAIHWGVCWFYQKASSIANNPNPPQPPDPPNPYVPGPWRPWDTATIRYNDATGGQVSGVTNYLERVHRAMKEGRHPTTADTYLWPLKSNKKARGNQ